MLWEWDLDAGARVTPLLCLLDEGSTDWRLWHFLVEKAGDSQKWSF